MIYNILKVKVTGKLLNNRKNNKRLSFFFFTTKFFPTILLTI